MTERKKNHFIAWKLWCAWSLPRDHDDVKKISLRVAKWRNSKCIGILNLIKNVSLEHYIENV